MVIVIVVDIIVGDVDVILVKYFVMFVADFIVEVFIIDIIEACNGLVVFS